MNRFALSTTIAFAATLFVACGPGQAYRMGMEHMQDGNYYQAVTALRQGCADRPNNEDVCAQVRVAEQELEGQAVANARMRMWEHDYPGAFNEVWTAQQLLPNSVALTNAETEVRADGVGHYTTRLDAGELRVAYEGAVMLADLFPRDTPTLTLRGDASTQYAEDLRIIGLEADESDQLGVALIFYSVAEDVEPEVGTSQRAREIRRVLEDEVRFQYDVSLDGLLVSSRVPTLADGQLAAQTERQDDEPHASLYAHVNAIRYNETYRAQMAGHDYLAGYETVENPAFVSAVSAVGEAERRRDTATATRDQAFQARVQANNQYQSAMGTTSEYTMQQAYLAADRTYNDASNNVTNTENELNNAIRTRDSTPQTVEREIWAVYNYEIRTYTREASADLLIRSDGDQSSSTEQRDVLTVETVDATHDEHQPVGLTSDPLNYPVDDATLYNQLIDESWNAAAAGLVREFNAYRERYRPNFERYAERHDPTLDMMARYLLLQTNSVSADVQNWVFMASGLRDGDVIVD